jgi:Hint domain
MTINPKVDRARRNALKAVGLSVGAIMATGITNKRASANPGNGNGPGRGNGGNGNHYGWGGKCFLRGTQILTRDGYRPIENLKAGDEIAARFAGFAPIEAIESFTLGRVRGAWTGPSRPVRVTRGALGDNVPATDLCLTASHAVFVDGLLVPVGDLVNGTSIVFETAADRDTLDFFHIALARHDVLDAQGAPCESLRAPAAQPCAPIAGFNGGRSELGSRLRSAVSPIVDRRRPIDVIRDEIEERGIALKRAA